MSLCRYDTIKTCEHNGTSCLDCVLDKIRDEIDDVYEDLDGYYPDSLGTLISKVDEIINKYKWSEDKK